MTGDFDRAGIDYKADYAEAGFSSMVNFYFPKTGDLDGIVYTWQAYSDSIQKYPNWHAFSYLNNSYNRDADMDNMINCATTFLLTPGVAQIFYGDETLRPLSDAQYNVDAAQAFRSDMNWDSFDEKVFNHYKKLGNIRKANPVIGTGKQRIIDTHTCVRYNDKDTLVIRLAVDAGEKINLGGAFPNGTLVTELYTGQTATVENSTVTFPRIENRLAVIK